MKTKILVMLLCGMLLTTTVVLAVPSNTTKTSMGKTPIASRASDDVPVWHVNDIWTYKVDNISLNYQQNNQTIFVTLAIDQLPLTVTSDTGDAYSLSFSTKVSGHGVIDVTVSQGPINMIVDFTNVQVSGTVMIDKTQLGIQSIDATLHGLIRLNIIEQPFVQLPLHHVPVPVTMHVSIDASAPFALLSFPLSTGMSYGLQATNFTLNGEIHSIWLYIIKFANAIMGIFGQPFLPDAIDALLPIINIKDALATFGMSNIVSIPQIPDLFSTGAEMETLTVPAGTFSVYNITIADGLGSIYYAPNAGNVVKISGNFHDVIPFIENIKMELTDTNYQA